MRISRNQLFVLLFLAETREVELTSNQIADAIEGVGRSGVYEAVGALQRAGLISARWDNSTGRRRRLLQVNADGLKAIEEETSDRERVRTAGRLVAAPHPLGSPATR